MNESQELVSATKNLVDNVCATELGEYVAELNRNINSAKMNRDILITNFKNYAGKVSDLYDQSLLAYISAGGTGDDFANSDVNIDMIQKLAENRSRTDAIIKEFDESISSMEESLKIIQKVM